MTRVIVLADTHIPGRARALPREVAQAIERADAVVHLGDFTAPQLADELERHSRFYAVYGNNDPEEIRQRYPIRRDLTIGRFHFVLIHGHVGGRNARVAARGIRGADVVLYGHSHIPHMECHRDAILFNPGSPTDRRQAPCKSFGIIDIGETVDARIVPLDGAI